MKVNIILSTYNGETYLAEQIDSILNQTYSEWTLLIRDDGSRDQTVEIIETYVRDNDRIRFINRDEIANIGVHRSFKALAAHDEADWYFLCDQDDVWLPHKLEKMLAAAADSDPGVPRLYYSDLSTVTPDLAIIAPRVKNTTGNYRAPDLKNYLTGPPVTGCAAMFNKALRDLWLADEEIIAFHDSFLGFLAVSMGELRFIDESLVLYRQHGDNEVGIADKSSISQSLQLFWGYNQAMRQRSQNVLDTFSDRLGADKKRILKDFCGIPQADMMSRLRTLLTYKYRYTLGDWKYTLFFNALLLTQIGNKS